MRRTGWLFAAIWTLFACVAIIHIINYFLR